MNEQLVFIRYVGEHFDGTSIYEFFFTDDMDTVVSHGMEEHGWDIRPANKKPTVFSEHMTSVGKVETDETKFQTVCESPVFGMEDAVDGIVALGWEKHCPDGEKRMVFRFGDTKQKTEDILYNREVLIQYKNINKCGILTN